ncbi:ORF6N domain-containing protein [Heliophilum fasciatum]|uniref:ORF6N domain-containing protein n=1 Tax=Heliophilum fasciatum TaxID=35700 RepID=A0A4R2RFJ1_9FIRM|nr:ORF6N domain-containing protein [Heliophilum fasciatum]TCP61248.1 ORF6N domain-containing protein [Heliophilum fasciatum]
MQQLQVIEKNGQRVLTTVQLAEAYGAELNRIRANFRRSKERYSEGKHYYALSGEEKRQFIRVCLKTPASQGSIHKTQYSMVFCAI